ncbi:MAG: hypothetical protein KGL39_55995, partial [Patescibacteria group bacterium]|nr:hypothetical protein [Patescibacteria group bacterium]
MANPNIPRGAIPIQRSGGASWRDSANVYFVPHGNTNALYVGDFVTKVTGSADTGGVNGIDLTAAGANPITGVVVGFVGACKAGAGLNAASFWPLTTSGGTMYRPASTTQDYYALVVDDPLCEFLIQENDDSGGVAGTPLPVTAVGKNANFVHAAGNVYGLSGTMLDANTVGTTNTLQL